MDPVVYLGDGSAQREEGVHIPQPEELLERLAAAGYDAVRCQSLHVIFGQEEYEKMLRQLPPFWPF